MCWLAPPPHVFCACVTLSGCSMVTEVFSPFSFAVAVDFQEFLGLFKQLYCQCRSVVSLLIIKTKN